MPSCALVDTHCHLDASEFDADRERMLRAAREAGVTDIVVPAVEPGTFDRVTDLAERARDHADDWPRVHFALGIHPLYVDAARDDDLDALRAAVIRWREHPAFIGIGEIGLDHFVPGLDRERQLRFLDAQLRLARDVDRPVILHVRKAVDTVTAALRRWRPRSGIAHAFNGSVQQARALTGLGMALGFGGAMTFTRALNIRRLVTGLPPESIVVETDAPDIAPAWLMPAGGRAPRNEPSELARIADVLADLRGIDASRLREITTANAGRVLAPAMPFGPERSPR